MQQPQNNTVFEAESPFAQSLPGFTLIEMLVAIAIAGLFMTGMLLSRGNFDSTVRLSSVSRNVALLVRQAQTYGAGGGSELEVGQPHGIYLDSSTPKKIVLYADNDGSPGFASSSADEAVETLNIAGPYTIKDFCIIDTGSMDSCSNLSSVSPDDLSIYFVRPSLEANFYSNTASASSTAQAIIEIAHDSSSAVERVKIDATGYISTP